jgi:hypothetical protein
MDMKLVLGAVAVAMAVFAVTASAQSDKPDVTVPSAQNSGAGISGYPGNKNGPAVERGTVGSNTRTTNPDNSTVKDQDPSNIKGLPGGKSGTAVKPPHERE